jgi:hypothetical protein
VTIRDDGLHYGEEGARIVAKWLTPQFRQLGLQHRDPTAVPPASIPG